MIMTMKHHCFRGGNDIKDGGFALEQMIERNKKHEISFFLEDNLTENSEGL